MMQANIVKELGYMDCSISTQKEIEDYSMCIKLAPQNADAYNNRGIAHALLKHYSQAVADFSTAIRLNSKNAEFYRNRARIYSNFGDPVQANKDYKQAMQTK